MDSLLYAKWLDLKEAERSIVEQRREIEDQMVESMTIDTTANSAKTMVDGGYKVTVTTRLSKRVDSDALQEIARDNGLFEHLQYLFRWKPEIDAKAWKSADQSITKPLLGAITTTPSRPSFKIELIED
jgi:hypothetical protein